MRARPLGGTNATRGRGCNHLGARATEVRSPELVSMRAARSQIEGTSVSVRKKGLGKKERPWVRRHRKDKQSALQTFYSFIHHEELICSTVYQNNFNSTGKAAQGDKVKKTSLAKLCKWGIRSSAV